MLRWRCQYLYLVPIYLGYGTKKRCKAQSYRNQTTCCDAQMTMPIFLLYSSFGEVQDRSKYHLDRMIKTCIFNLFHMCKVGLFYPTCREMCHTLPKMHIYWRDLEFIIHTMCGGIFFSLDGDGVVFLVMHLGLLGVASLWSILDGMS